MPYPMMRETHTKNNHNHSVDMSGLMTLRLLHSFDQRSYACNTCVISFTFAHNKIQSFIVNDPQYRVIKDTYANFYLKRFFQSFLRHSFETCQSRYILVKNGKVIGEVCENTLESTVTFRCYYECHSWDISEEYVDPQNTFTMRDSYGNECGDSELLQSLEVDFEMDAMTSMHNTKRRVKSFDLIRRSVPF